MRKTPTIFDRDWDGNRGVVAKLVVWPSHDATEKLDGTNVRVTVRSEIPVRLEKRRNPSKDQKRDGIEEPWYVDASRDDPADRFLFEALAGRSLEGVPDGEWSAEAVGPKIQGNPLKLTDHRLFFFDRDRLPPGVCVPALEDVPVLAWPDGEKDAGEVFFDALRDYLITARSSVNPEVGIEGIVWHGDDGWAKLKLKDYK
jgi:hypothetical protein